MKRTLVIVIMAVCLSGCWGPNYKNASIEYLKSKIADPASFDTIKFFKPDSIYLSFYDTRAYMNMADAIDSLRDENDTVAAARLTLLLNKKINAYHKIITGWDVRLVYKSKDKKGKMKRDTCRLLFNTNLNKVKNFNGVSLVQD
jgi:hypothetical protein